MEDLPFGGHTCGVDEAEALSHAPDALRTALSLVMERGLDIPTPSPEPTGTLPLVCLPSLVDEAKVELYRILRASGLAKTELARRMGISKQQAERLLDLDHTSRMEQLELAFRAIGKRLAWEVRDAA